MDHLKLTFDQLSVDAISDLVVDDSCGAVSLFVGTTRDNFEGKKVVRLEYEAYEPMALKAMKALCDEVRDKWPAVHGIAMYHRLGIVPARQASVVLAVSSPHRREAIDATAHLIERLKASVPIWKKEVYDAAPPVWKENAEYPHMRSRKKEVYDAAPPVWKENAECPPETSSKSPPRPTLPPTPPPCPDMEVDPNLIQINVSSEELQQRIQNFIERKREQVNINNIHDYIPSKGETEVDEEETCARVRTQFVRRKDLKGNLKTRKVYNEWGPQTAWARGPPPAEPLAPGLPASIAERVVAAEAFLSLGSVQPDVFRRLKAIEDRIAHLQAMSPEYAMFWKNNKSDEVKEEFSTEYAFTADDIARKIELLEQQG